MEKAETWTRMIEKTPGNDERFRRLYERHGDDLRAYCRRRLGPDEAEDALAETFVIVWRRIEQIPARDEARLWLYGVARNVIRNSRRGSRRRTRLLARLTSMTEPGRAGPAESAETRAEHNLVLTALSSLRGTDQEILRLHAWEDLTRSEIAITLDISVPAVDMRLHRAIRRMGRALEAVGMVTSTEPRAASGGGSR